MITTIPAIRRVVGGGMAEHPVSETLVNQFAAMADQMDRALTRNPR